MDSLFDAARSCLACSEPERKIVLSNETAQAFAAGTLHIDGTSPPPPAAVETPGRPARPRLVAPRDLPRRGLGSRQGRSALVHAVAHIEFNAINLAWDAVYRFRDMPRAFYRDWVSVAADEARHFGWLQARLGELGCTYGDFPAHDGLWEMARRTGDSCLARMALVPRVLEARGLDVTPGMITRLRQAGDGGTVAILERILHEEVAHVAAGTRWFEYCCGRENLQPQATFRRLLDEHMQTGPKPPFNRPARLQAGFSGEELDRLEARAG